MIVYEAGVRGIDNNYCKFIESPKESDVDEYIGIMKEIVSENNEIVKLIKTYDLVSTTPYIVNRSAQE